MNKSVILSEARTWTLRMTIRVQDDRENAGMTRRVAGYLSKVSRQDRNNNARFFVKGEEYAKNIG
ncbi:MAG: hypothetical protein WC848_06415 [Parcubacteria group bacterium]